MKNLKRTFEITSLVLLLNTIFATPSNAASFGGVKASTQQILLDTGGGGGEGANLPGIRWTFAITTGGNPFIFWSWSPN